MKGMWGRSATSGTRLRACNSPDPSLRLSYQLSSHIGVPTVGPSKLHVTAKRSGRRTLKQTNLNRLEVRRFGRALVALTRVSLHLGVSGQSNPIALSITRNPEGDVPLTHFS